MLKKIGYVASVVVPCGVMAIASAEVPTELTTALTGAASDMTDAISAVAPVAISVVVAVLVWKFGIKFFKGLAK